MLLKCPKILPRPYHTQNALNLDAAAIILVRLTHNSAEFPGQIRPNHKPWGETRPDCWLWGAPKDLLEYYEFSSVRARPAVFIKATVHAEILNKQFVLLLLLFSFLFCFFFLFCLAALLHSTLHAEEPRMEPPPPPHPTPARSLWNANWHFHFIFFPFFFVFFLYVARWFSGVFLRLVAIDSIWMVLLVFLMSWIFSWSKMAAYGGNAQSIPLIIRYFILQKKNFKLISSER